ncbi:MAG: glycosyltransferase family 4 protein [Lachnospiraceae bacterium]|nr:glycosyltransferase family 4 protein [Lachnospiraceae bacterium]
MKIFVIGDHLTGTGPSNVTAKYIEGLNGRCMKQIFRSRALRAAEMILKIPFSKVILCSGYSAQNVMAMKIARFWKRKCAYLMHGCVEHENRINHCEDPVMTAVERQTLLLADKILAVSDVFAAWLKENYPEYRDKIVSMPNGADKSDINDHTGSYDIKRDYNMILSIGGGMPRKRIVNICKAVKGLKEDPKYKDLYLTVIGDKGADSDKINSYPFVENKGIVSHEEAVRLMRKAGMFIQNSSFETFGLAPLEALNEGCDILLSSNVGAISLFKEIDDRYIIRDCEDIEEIKEKIRNLTGEHNNTVLLSNIDKGSASWERRTKELSDLLMTLI